MAITMMLLIRLFLFLFQLFAQTQNSLLATILMLIWILRRVYLFSDAKEKRDFSIFI